MIDDGRNWGGGEGAEDALHDLITGWERRSWSGEQENVG